LQPLVDRQVVPAAVGRDGLTPDEFHHEVGLATLCRSDIEQACNVWVLEGGTDLAFTQETFASTRIEQRAPDDL